MLRRFGGVVLLMFALALLSSCETDKAKIGASIDSSGSLIAVFRPCEDSARVSRVQLISYDHGKRTIWDIESKSGSDLRRFTVGKVPPEFVEHVAFIDDASTDLQFRIESNTVNSQESFRRGALSIGNVVLRGKIVSLDQFERSDTCP